MDESVNIQALIDSGDLELFVLGALPEDQMRKITQLADAHPSLQAEIEYIESALIMTAESAVSGPPSDNILTRALAQMDEDDSGSAPVLPLHSGVQSSSSPRRRSFEPVWAWAAAIVLLIVSVVLNVYFYNDLSGTEQELLALRQENQEIAQNFRQTSNEYDYLKEQVAILESPATRRIDLEGVPGNDNSRVTIFWEPEKAEVLLAGAQLPEPPTGLQYQLWAIIDGTPVDAGLLEGLASWQKMKSISGAAAAFAITLEPEGGSASPTLDQMVVIGYV